VRNHLAPIVCCPRRRSSPTLAQQLLPAHCSTTHHTRNNTHKCVTYIHTFLLHKPYDGLRLRLQSVLSTTAFCFISSANTELDPGSDSKYIVYFLSLITKSDFQQSLLQISSIKSSEHWRMTLPVCH